MSWHNWALAIALSAAFAQAPAVPMSAPAILDAVKLRVRLLAPLTTKLNRKGDMVSAKVVNPGTYEGAFLEGDIREVRAGGGTNKTSTIQFQFHTLHFTGSAIPISASLQAVINSKSVKGADDDGGSFETGQAIENTAKHSLGSAVRTLGNAQKEPSQPGSIRLAIHASHLSLAVGSELVLRVSSR